MKSVVQCVLSPIIISCSQQLSFLKMRETRPLVWQHVDLAEVQVFQKLKKILMP